MARRRSLSLPMRRRSKRMGVGRGGAVNLRSVRVAVSGRLWFRRVRSVVRDLRNGRELFTVRPVQGPEPGTLSAVFASRRIHAMEVPRGGRSV